MLILFRLSRCPPLCHCWSSCRFLIGMALRDITSPRCDFEYYLTSVRVTQHKEIAYGIPNLSRSKNCVSTITIVKY